MKPSARMRGVGLVELMISLSLGLITVGVIGWVYLGSVQTFRSHDQLSRLQESGRYAFEFISKDVRMAGATGCSMSTNHTAIAGTGWYRDLFTKPLSSINKDPTDVGEANEMSDALTVLRADVSNEFIVSNHNATTKTFTLTTNHNFSTGDLIVVTDCVHAAVFQASSASGNTIRHEAGGVPGNVSGGDLGTSGAYTFPAGSRIYPLSAVTYYVANNAVGVPSLFRRRPGGTTAADVDEELVEGVEDLEVTYAVDSDSPPDGQANYYNPATPYLDGDTVSGDAGLGANEEERWQRVVSVRVSLLMRTVEDRVVPVEQTYSFRGDPPAPAGDKRLRKVFTHVVKLRNR